jgi:hypothetical protein
MAQISRVDGQIWIDKNQPYRLKYHVAEEDYSVETAVNYEIPFNSAPLVADKNLYAAAGRVVKLSGKNTIADASFPADIENVLGVLEANITGSYNEDNKLELAGATVSRNSHVIIDHPELVFVNLGDEFNDLDISKNGWKNLTAGIGAPVYWFIGRTVLENGEYKHYDSSKTGPNGTSLAGKLTLATPSGFKWNVNDIDDNSLNVGYDNLPTVGTVVNYQVSNNIITQIEIHLNFAKFDSSLEWSWPYLHKTHSPEKDGDCGKISPTIKDQSQSTVSFDIHHGLFADTDTSGKLKVRNYCDILATDDPTSSNEYIVATGITNTYTGTNRKTTLNISTPDSLYYRISGRVNYEFDKNHE